MATVSIPKSTSPFLRCPQALSRARRQHCRQGYQNMCVVAAAVPGGRRLRRPERLGDREPTRSMNALNRRLWQPLIVGGPRYAGRRRFPEINFHSCDALKRSHDLSDSIVVEVIRIFPIFDVTAQCLIGHAMNFSRTAKWCIHPRSWKHHDSSHVDIVSTCQDSDLIQNRHASTKEFPDTWLSGGHAICQQFALIVDRHQASPVLCFDREKPSWPNHNVVKIPGCGSHIV